MLNIETFSGSIYPVIAESLTNYDPFYLFSSSGLLVLLTALKPLDREGASTAVFSFSIGTLGCSLSAPFKAVLSCIRGMVRVSIVLITGA